MSVDFNHWCPTSEVQWLALKVRRKQWLKKASKNDRYLVQQGVYVILAEAVEDPAQDGNLPGSGPLLRQNEVPATESANAYRPTEEWRS